MSSTVSPEVDGGRFVQVPWTAGMTAQDALEAAYNELNRTATFTYALQFCEQQRLKDVESRNVR